MKTFKDNFAKGKHYRKQINFLLIFRLVLRILRTFCTQITSIFIQPFEQQNHSISLKVMGQTNKK
jgi:hypothetical protein